MGTIPQDLVTKVALMVAPLQGSSKKKNIEVSQAEVSSARKMLKG